MAGIRLAALLRRLRRDTAPESDESTDAALVARFASTRDESAFELLVRRHGAMVLAACRRVLGHTEDAEDAFQAAFLVLARKAASVRDRNGVPAWLHRVAVRIARRAAVRRRPIAVLAAEPTARPAPDAAERAELRGLLDTEIDRLSEPFRRAFVLCYLEGLTNAEAARVLGCPVGTIESRLAAARRTLRDRLVRRVELPAGILALLACPPGLSADTVTMLTRAGVVAAQSGLRATIGIVREPAVVLAEYGVHAMTKTLRTWSAVVLGVTLLGLAAGVGWANRSDEPPAEPAVAADTPARPPAAPMPKSVDPPSMKGGAWPLAKQIGADDYRIWGKLIGVSFDSKSIIILKDTTIHDISLVTKNREHDIQSENTVSGVAISSNGKYLATAEGANGVKLRDASGRVIETLWSKSELPAWRVEFTPDGNKLVALYWGSAPAKAGAPKRKTDALQTTRLTRVSVWDLTTRKELGHPALTDTAESSAQPQYTLSGNGLFVLREGLVYQDAVEGTPAGRRVVKSRRFTIIDALSGAEERSFEVAGESTRTFRVNPLSPDGKTVVLHDDTSKELRFVNAQTGKDRFRVPAFRRPVKAVAFSGDGRYVAAATGKLGFQETDPIAAPSEVFIWDAATGRELARLTDEDRIRNYSALAFSPDGSFLVAQAAQSPVDRPLITIWGRLPPTEPEPTKPVAKVPDAVPTRPAPKAAETGAAPARFQALIRDLSATDVTDARRIETLFVAALGRLPTEIESRTLVAQIAKREDKGTALADLLGVLIETAEFKAHAAELGRLAK